MSANNIESRIRTLKEWNGEPPPGYCTTLGIVGKLDRGDDVSPDDAKRMYQLSASLIVDKGTRNRTSPELASYALWAQDRFKVAFRIARAASMVPGVYPVLGMYGRMDPIWSVLGTQPPTPSTVVVRIESCVLRAMMGVIETAASTGYNQWVVLDGHYGYTQRSSDRAFRVIYGDPYLRRRLESFYQAKVTESLAFLRNNIYRLQILGHSTTVRIRPEHVARFRNKIEWNVIRINRILSLPHSTQLTRNHVNNDNNNFANEFMIHQQQQPHIFNFLNNGNENDNNNNNNNNEGGNDPFFSESTAVNTPPEVFLDRLGYTVDEPFRAFLEKHAPDYDALIVKGAIPYATRTLWNKIKDPLFH